MTDSDPLRSLRPTEVLAYALDYLKRSDDGVNRVEKSMKVVNDHNRELYVRYKSNLIRSRDFYSRQVWRKEADGSLMVVATPMESEEHPKLPNVVRGRFPLVMKLVEEGEGTKVEYLIQLDFGGRVPAQVTNSYMSSSLAYVTKMQQHFQKRHGLEEFTAGDGRLVGDALCTRTEAEEHRDKGETAAAARVRDMFGSYAGLKQARESFVFLPQLVTAAAENSLSLGADVKKRLDQLEEADGRKIGQALASTLAGTKMGPVVAVDRWIKRYPALVEMDKQEKWFRPMMEAMARRLVDEVGWAAKRRL